jgi:MATE family multidrug resistance protein
VLRRGVSYSLQLGVAAMLVLLLLGPLGLKHAGLADGLGEGASPALRIFALSMPGYLVSVAAQFFLEALHKPKAGMWAMWVANGINLALNLLLVPDVLGLGIHGAAASAWATFAARTSLAVFLIVYILRLPEARELGVFLKPARSAGRARAAQGRLRRRLQLLHRGRGLRRHDLHRRPAGRDRDLGLGHRAQCLGHRLHGPMGLSAATAVLVGRAYGRRTDAACCGPDWSGSA